jgi:ribosomal protein S18 acetylase RimI-like enzyme
MAGTVSGAGPGREDVPGAVAVRAARPDEGGAVGRLTERVYRAEELVDDDYAAELRDGESRVRTATVLVAELGGRLVGAVTAAQPGTPWAEIARAGELEMRMFAVDAEARRRGIAAALMDGVEGLAPALGLGAVVLSTEPEMAAAHRLYERRGYVRQPHRDWHPGPYHLLVYRRDLAGSPPP